MSITWSVKRRNAWGGALASVAAVSSVLAAAGAPVVVATSPVSPGRDAPAFVSASTILGGQWGDDTTKEDEKASSTTGTWQADKDLGSLWSITKNYGFQKMWGKSDPQGRKITGKGVTVAVIDTGIAPVPGLAGPEKVVNGPDLSFESQVPNTRYLDHFGHGTHMAAIIAGRDADVPVGKETEDDYFVGMAPDAKILNVKVGAGDGGADVSQIIAAVDWVVQHRNDNGMNVRVINLSYGTHSLQSYELDPLAHAVENAWRAGIVVVVSAGNDGLESTSLTMPAMDPYVLAVGAVDHRGTSNPDDDVVASFSNGGSVIRRPDVLAPGKSVVSLRVPGSYIDAGHPEGLVTGDTAQRFFRGSGTSQSAAVVSGAVALLLQQRPSLTPDQVKFLLKKTAVPLKSNPTPAMGAGVISVERLIDAATPSAPTAAQVWPVSTGLGSLEESRGGSHVADPMNGVVLTGEVDALASRWDASSWSTASAAGTSWAGGQWNGASWSGDSWSATSWSGAAWAASSWSGLSWSGVSWADHLWSTDYWDASRWDASRWDASRWDASRWDASRWDASRWDASRWDGGAWLAAEVW